MSKMDLKFISSICQAHQLTTNSVISRMMGVGVPLNRINHLFDPGSHDEFITYCDVGFNIVKEITGEGKVSIHAIPGHFRGTMTGKQWVNDPRDAILTAEEREREIISHHLDRSKKHRDRMLRTASIPSSTDPRGTISMGRIPSVSPTSLRTSPVLKSRCRPS